MAETEKAPRTGGEKLLVDISRLLCRPHSEESKVRSDGSSHQTSSAIQVHRPLWLQINSDIMSQQPNREPNIGEANPPTKLQMALNV